MGRTASLFAVLAILASNPSAAQDTATTAEILGQACKEAITFWEERTGPDDFDAAITFSMRAGLCAGYIRGFHGAHEFMAAQTGKSQFCIPKTVTETQMAKVLVSRAEQAPELGHAPALALLIGSLQSA